MMTFMHAIRQLGRHMFIIGPYSEVHSPFERNYSVHLGNWRPNVEQMKEAADTFIGTHDFTSFCSSKTATCQ